MPLLANPNDPGFTEVTDSPEELKKTYDSAFELLRDAQANNRNFMLAVIRDDDIVMSGNCRPKEMYEISKVIAREAVAALTHGLFGKK